ncbi:hypothetical protein QUF94_25050 [Peribacillus sp. NJ4]|uniref:hypothetical protein n=1 Tax=unclassified Peribacillus TaxID=2675266 RepID=UPI0025A1BB66|nr:MULTISPECIES: hypothetical protein [unclassified Peribacillus]MDM5214654.1 hypothetical protein [Peribacillus sp. NJ4]MDM5224491.1 hypothetical protein [Peribacillus sp. NJ11]
MEETLQLVDKLADQDLDYLHISVGGFWNGSICDDNNQTSRVVMIHERVGDRVPVIGVGMLRTPDEVMKAFEIGVPLIALGRELIMEPQWVQKYKPVKKTKSVQHYLKKIKKNWLFLIKCGSTILASLAGFLLYKEFTYLIPSLLP